MKEEDKASEVGRYTYGHDAIRVEWSDRGKLYIGSFCSISRGLTVLLGGDHRTEWITTYPFGHIHRGTFGLFGGEGHPMTRGDVIIGNDVWIGSDVTIMSGVRIGDGAVVGANSHVVKDVHPYCVVGGNPAKVIRKRFSDAQISDLLDLAWWTWPEAKIEEASPLLCSDSIEDFLNKFKS